MRLIHINNLKSVACILIFWGLSISALASESPKPQIEFWMAKKQTSEDLSSYINSLNRDLVPATVTLNKNLLGFWGIVLNENGVANILNEADLTVFQDKATYDNLMTSRDGHRYLEVRNRLYGKRRVCHEFNPDVSKVIYGSAYSMGQDTNYWSTGRAKASLVLRSKGVPDGVYLAAVRTLMEGWWSNINSPTSSIWKTNVAAVLVEKNYLIIFESRGIRAPDLSISSEFLHPSFSNNLKTVKAEQIQFGLTSGFMMSR